MTIKFLNNINMTMSTQKEWSIENLPPECTKYWRYSKIEDIKSDGGEITDIKIRNTALSFEECKTIYNNN